MQPIASTFTDRTFVYTQVERQGDVAIYEQRHKESDVTRYEVVRIRVAPAHTWPNGTASPEREVYPGSGHWGSAGWTLYRLSDAQALVQSLTATSGEHEATAPPGEPAQDTPPAMPITK